jgi:hypothetical protein
MTAANPSALDRIIRENYPALIASELGELHGPQETLLRDLKHAIEQQMADEKTNSVVQYDWLTLAEKLVTDLGTAELQLYDNGNLGGIFSTLALFRYITRLNSHDANVTVIRSANIAEVAIFFLLELKFSTNKMATSDVSAATPLGPLAVQFQETTPGGKYKWLYKNMAFTVASADAGTALAISQGLQKLAQAHVVPAA